MADRLTVKASFTIKRWWVKVLLVWAATRLVSTGLFLALAQTQDANYWTDAKPDYFDFLNIWDAEWFERIFRDGFGGAGGYPLELPLDQFGYVAQNPWAFMPGFPFLVRAVSFGLDWSVAAPTLTLLLGFIFALLAYRILLHRFDEKTSLLALALIGCAGPAIIFQAGYADTLGLVFLAAGLLLILQRRYLLAILPLVALGVTRPGLVALSLALGALWVVRWWRSRTQADQVFQLGERLRLALLTIVTAAAGWLWAAIAWLVTGRSDAYLATELAWRAGFLGEPRLRLFEGWYAAPAYFWSREWGPWLMYAVIAAALGLLATQAVRRLGLELWLWVASYYLYLLLVFFPQSSTFRILLMAFPLFGSLAWWARKWHPGFRWLLLGLAVASQWWWLWECWRYVSPDFSPP